MTMSTSQIWRGKEWKAHMLAVWHVNKSSATNETNCNLRMLLSIAFFLLFQVNTSVGKLKLCSNQYRIILERKKQALRAPRFWGQFRRTWLPTSSKVPHFFFSDRESLVFNFFAIFAKSTSCPSGSDLTNCFLFIWSENHFWNQHGVWRNSKECISYNRISDCEKIYHFAECKKFPAPKLNIYRTDLSCRQIAAVVSAIRQTA